MYLISSVIDQVSQSLKTGKPIQDSLYCLSRLDRGCVWLSHCPINLREAVLVGFKASLPQIRGS